MKRLATSQTTISEWNLMMITNRQTTFRQMNLWVWMASISSLKTTTSSNHRVWAQILDRKTKVRTQMRRAKTVSQAERVLKTTKVR